MSTAPDPLSIPAAGTRLHLLLLVSTTARAQLPLRDALVRRLRGWVIASHQASTWPPGPPGVCSAPASQRPGRPLPKRHRWPIGTEAFPPGPERPGMVDSRNRQDVPQAGAPAARSMLYPYLVISSAVTFGGGRGRIRPAQVVLILGAVEQVRVPGTAVQDQFSHRQTALGNHTVG